MSHSTTNDEKVKYSACLKGKLLVGWASNKAHIADQTANYVVRRTPQQQIYKLGNHSLAIVPSKKQHAAAGFSKYENMRLEQRQEQISRAKWLVGGRPIHFSPSPAVTKSSLQDRLESNSNTSTSEPRLEAIPKGRVGRKKTAVKPWERVRPFYMTYEDPEFDSETGTFSRQVTESSPLKDTHSMAAQAPAETSGKSCVMLWHAQWPFGLLAIL